MSKQVKSHVFLVFVMASLLTGCQRQQFVECFAPPVDEWDSLMDEHWRDSGMSDRSVGAWRDDLPWNDTNAALAADCRDPLEYQLEYLRRDSVEAFWFEPVSWPGMRISPSPVSIDALPGNDTESLEMKPSSEPDGICG